MSKTLAEFLSTPYDAPSLQSGVCATAVLGLSTASKLMPHIKPELLTPAEQEQLSTEVQAATRELAALSNKLRFIVTTTNH